MAIFGVVIGAYLLRAYRGRMGTMVQQALIWVLIFLAAVIIYGFKGQLQDQLFPFRGTIISDEAVSISRARDGHFYAGLLVNDVRVEFVIDTGASEIFLSAQDARKVGISPESLIYRGTAETANGTVRTAVTSLQSLEFSGVIDKNVRVLVSEGQMNVSLLGMSYLRLFERFEIIDDTLVLQR
ncbi:hypothetical protein A9Q96_02370 [Rhodobacterales bacterium 52_120_T64]|nr:hypothetical protein A9Q96_02370 [Rhodobacterales bacterium 52_120_T64]